MLPGRKISPYPKNLPVCDFCWPYFLRPTDVSLVGEGSSRTKSKRSGKPDRSGTMAVRSADIVQDTASQPSPKTVIDTASAEQKWR